ncbi:PTS system IIB component (galactitol/fructose specific) [Streptococcus pneumoniae]|nr:PTS system IIB component (galactitol/fructose specific) [Streptococcus pneumoniae]
MNDEASKQLTDARFKRLVGVQRGSWEYDIFTPIAATDLGFEPGIPVIEAGPILFRIPAMSAPVFDNIEAAIKEHGLS